MKNYLSKTWSQYEAGKEYKRRIGLYETVHRNERYYRGDQWESGAQDLPKPVFNLVRRITDYLICTVASGKVNIHYSGEILPLVGSERDAELIRKGIEAIDKNAAYRWERSKLDHLVYGLLTDAAISGDGAIYCYWDPKVESGQLFSGDIVTSLVDSTCVFPADVNKADVQSQEYVILSGRESVSRLRAEAEAMGIPADKVAKIEPDSEYSVSAGDLGAYELSGDDEAKATYLVKFWKENGFVCFEKSVRECVLRRVKTACRLYPIAFFNWYPTKNCFHGTSPVSGMIPNQKFINRAYAMVMKHMTDTAFSKVIYDKSRIPEWSNKVGEAIASMGGGNVADSVAVVGVGQLQSGYGELIDSAIKMTKELSGATDSALGDVSPSNTSAILALQETSRLPLDQVKAGFARCIEDMANIWADMMCAYYPDERLLPAGESDVAHAEFSRLSGAMLRAKVNVTSADSYGASGRQAVLDKLLECGQITAEQYVSQLPSDALENKEKFLEELRLTKTVGETEAGKEANDECR